jgi:hypothetical protein
MRNDTGTYILIAAIIIAAAVLWTGHNDHLDRVEACRDANARMERTYEPVSGLPYAQPSCE